jgi:PAS domain S-box-containing protein
VKSETTPAARTATPAAPISADRNDGGPAAKIVIIASSIVALIGAAALLSWALDVRLLRGATALRHGMTPGTAVAVLLASVALRASALRTTWLRWAAVVAAAGTTFFAAAAFGASTLGWDTSALDLLFFAERVSRPGEVVPVGRMAVNTAVALALLGLSLMVLLVGGTRLQTPRLRWQHALVTGLAGLAFSIGFVAAIGYLHGVAGLYTVRGLGAMAPNTAATVILLAVGVMFGRPSRGLAGTITGDDAGAVLMRRLLPVIIIAPVGIGALRVLAVDAGLVDSNTATIVRTLVEVVLLLAIVLITAKRLRAVDADRARGYLAEREARARAEQLQALSALLSAARTPRDVARLTLEAGSAAVGLRSGSVYVVTDGERPRDTLSLVHAMGYDEATTSAWGSIPNTGDSLAGDAVARRQPVVVGRRSELMERYPALRPLVETTTYCGGAVFPLLGGSDGPGNDVEGDVAIGMIGFDFNEERDIADADLRFLGALAQLCAQALDRARLFEAEQVAREEAVAERRRLTRILDTLPVGVVVVDTTAGVVHVNPSSDYILGNSLKPVAGLTDYATYGGGLHADGRPYSPEDYPIARALLHGEVVHQELTRYRRGDGRDIVVSISAAPVRNADGEIEFAVAALEDVSDRETTRAAAIEANRVKSQFLANMSHELRTPLNAITGHVQLMEIGIHGPVTDAQIQALGRVQKAGRHLLSLINDVLDYARIEAGRVDVEMQPISLLATIREVVQIVEPQAQLKGVELNIAQPDGAGGDPEPVLVLADGDKLAQALFNLLANAIKFTPAWQSTGEPGRVTVRLPGADDMAEVAEVLVEDSGIGIPEELHEAIFAPFVQVRPGYTREHQGAGLGLAISRDLLRAMNGDLQVRSSPGEGSTFIMTLRRAIAPRDALT